MGEINKELDIKSLLGEFIKKVYDDKINILIKLNESNVEINEVIETIDIVYNEVSLQHELVDFLKNRLAEINTKYDYYIKFEKKVRFQRKNISGKSEIDIVIIETQKGDYKPERKYAIELKYPRNGEYPNQLKKFYRDIQFMKQVKEDMKYYKTYCLVLVEQNPFYLETSLKIKNKENELYYNMFRENKEIKFENKIYKLQWHKLEKIDRLNNIRFEDEVERIKKTRYYIIET